MKFKKPFSDYLSYFSSSLLLSLPAYVFSAETESLDAEVTKTDAVTTETVITEPVTIDPSVQAVVNSSTSLGIDPTSGHYLLQMATGLFVVLLCIIALAWFAKKMNRFQSFSGGPLNIIASLGMGARERVVLLQVADKQILIGVSAGNIQALHVLETPIDLSEKQTTTTSGDSFADKLKTMITNANASVTTKKR